MIQQGLSFIRDTIWCKDRIVHDVEGYLVQISVGNLSSLYHKVLNIEIYTTLQNLLTDALSLDCTKTCCTLERRSFYTVISYMHVATCFCTYNVVVNRVNRFFVIGICSSKLLSSISFNQSLYIA